MNSLDFTILNFIYQHWHSEMLDTIMPVISELGNAGMIWIALTVLLLLSRTHRITGVALMCALALDVVVCNLLLKHLVARVRPYDVNTAIELLVARASDYSFPSGHTAASFTAVSALYCRREKLWKPALLLAMLIAFSRLYLYMHYPTDILGGIALGIIMGYLGCKGALYCEKLWKRDRQHRPPHDSTEHELHK